MKIAIIGYGKMGQAIEQEIKNTPFSISKIIDDEKSLRDAEFSSDEVAIEFTEPQAHLNNIKILASKKVDIVSGTTGCEEHIEEIKKIVLANNIGFLRGTNFALGVHLFWKIVQNSAQLIDKLDEYDVFGHEIHHSKKKDSPSGTAITTAEILLKNIQRKNNIVTEKINREISDNELHFSSTRGGNAFGIHEVYYDSPCDTIKISHTSKGRSSYSKGAINCAKWLQDKKGFFTVDNYIKDRINE